MKLHTYSRFSLIGVLLLGASAANAGLIDFEGLDNGTVVNNQFQSYGLTISAMNRGVGPDLAVVFDSDETGTQDPDLQYAGNDKEDYDAGFNTSQWTGGNIATQRLGNLLIIQENSIGCGDGVCDAPDDERSRPAGSLYFKFAHAIDSFGLDLVDVEGPSEYNDDSGFFAVFLLDDDEIGRVGFSELLDPFPHPSNVAFGDNFANRIDPISAADLDIGKFNAVEINLGGSAAVDNIRWTTVPEPEIMLLLALGLIGVRVSSRRLAAR